MEKTFAVIDPQPDAAFEEVEHHYVNAHVALGRRLMMADPSRMAYYTQKVKREYDLSGSWANRLTAWRLIIAYFDVELADTSAEDRSTFPEAMRKTMGRDGRFCVGGMRRCEVEEAVIVDRRIGQTSQTKYIFEYDRNPDMPHDEAMNLLRERLAPSLEAAKSADGVQWVTFNKVLHQSERLPGIGMTGRYAKDTVKLAYVEFLFDNTYFGDRFFAEEGRVEALLSSEFGLARGMHVEEVCEFDRRPPATSKKATK